MPEFAARQRMWCHDERGFINEAGHAFMQEFQLEFKARYGNRFLNYVIPDEGRLHGMRVQDAVDNPFELLSSASIALSIYCMECPSYWEEVKDDMDLMMIAARHHIQSLDQRLPGGQYPAEMPAYVQNLGVIAHQLYLKHKAIAQNQDR